MKVSGDCWWVQVLTSHAGVQCCQELRAVPPTDARHTCPFYVAEAVPTNSLFLLTYCSDPNLTHNSKTSHFSTQAEGLMSEEEKSGTCMDPKLSWRYCPPSPVQQGLSSRVSCLQSASGFSPLSVPLSHTPPTAIIALSAAESTALETVVFSVVSSLFQVGIM